MVHVAVFLIVRGKLAQSHCAVYIIHSVSHAQISNASVALADITLQETSAISAVLAMILIRDVLDVRKKKDVQSALIRF